MHAHRLEVSREAALRHELEAQMQASREEKEGRARGRLLKEAVKQRDQAARTAHSLELALRRSQVRCYGWTWW
jgi:hypothetical protein